MSISSQDNQIEQLKKKLSHLVNHCEVLYRKLSRQETTDARITHWEKIVELQKQIDAIEKQLFIQSDGEYIISNVFQSLDNQKPAKFHEFQFGDYLITQLLSQTIHSNIYLAFDTKNKRYVTIETLLPAFVMRHHLLTSLEKTINDVVNLNNEMIVPIFEYGEYKGQPYLAAKYMAGGSLSDLITSKRGNPPPIISLRDVSYLLTRLAKALDAAHKNNIYHGNIYPAHIVANEQKEWFLSHFGFSQIIDQAQTISQSYIEASPYMAPEQWKGEPLGAFTDVYQLGAVIFQVLTGKLPFKSDDLVPLMQAHLNEDVPSAHELEPEIPTSCDDVLRRAMAKEPPERFKSVGEFAVAFLDAVMEKNIGRYQIKREIGQGVTSVVYLAHDTQMWRDVAIKLMKPTESSADQHRFNREVRTISNLRHAGIVSVYDVGEHGQQPYLVMEYMSGGSLQDQLQQSSGPMQWGKARDVLKGIADALMKAHASGIIHCDIKPGNVLIDEDGKYYLSDFGIARHMERLGTTTSISGTPSYMAPEQFEENALDTFTDVYQLGVMAFELLTGKRPFVAENMAQLIQKHLHEPIPSACMINQNLPPACDAVFSIAMAKKQKDRYPTPQAFLDALNRSMVTIEIDRYQIQRILGRGGMAIVYLAYDPRTGRDVAIKMLPQSLIATPQSLQRFRREARMIAKLEHNAIVPVYDIPIIDGIPYLVMRHMVGGTLRDRLITKKGPLVVTEVLNILDRLVEALNTSHNKKIIHCDIKPANVLLDESGVSFLSDFGIARNMVDQSTSTKISGTAYYMAPEQWEGERVGVYTDIYQLGVMLFEMLTGERPFEATTRAPLMNHHLNSPVPPPHEINPNLPKACHTIFQKAMAKNPRDRFGSLEGLSLALKQALKPELRGNGRKNERKTIGRYLIKNKLAQGGMATVYLAHDPQENRDVAIKMIKPERAEEKRFRTRFQREAKIISELDHPAIIPVYDFGEENGLLYLVMRYLEGGTLADLIKQRPLPLLEITRILNRLCPGLDVAHKHGIVHRDLKPANILLDVSQQPYLSDFGIVKVIGAEDTSSTEDGALLGTVAYMSPEQIEGNTLDKQSDIFSLGVILFEMLTGEKPFAASSLPGTLQRRARMEIPNLEQINPKLAKAFKEIVAKALAINPQDRFLSASALATAVQQLVNKLSLEGSSSLHPFHFREPVSPDNFWGRKTVLRNLRSRLNNRESTAVIAPPGYGKSSLLLKLSVEAKNLPNTTMIPALISLAEKDDTFTQSQFWQAALSPLSEVTNETRLTKLFQQAEAREFDSSTVRRIFGTLAARTDFTLLLMLDDFDRLLSYAQFQKPNFYAFLRTLLSVKGRLVIIITSHLSISKLRQLGKGLLDQGEPFLDEIIDEIFLASFSPDTARTILAKDKTCTPPDVQTQIQHIAGRNPRLLQTTAAIWTLAPPEEKNLRTNVYFRSFRDAYCQNLWTALDKDSQKILLLLALAEQTSSKIIISRELNNLRQHLINLQKAGIITKQETVNLPGLQVNSKTTWKIIPQAIVWWFIDV
ncbi:MAG: serine/threonine protein kinase, partial [Chloroflexi bacterium]